MAIIKRGEVWIVDFGLAAKIRPALLLTGPPADNELDLVTVLLHTTAMRGNPWELAIPKPFLKPGTFHLQQGANDLHGQARTTPWNANARRDESRGS